MHCESCRKMRGTLRVLCGRIDYKSYSCKCASGLCWNESMKEPQQFEYGTQSAKKNHIYEKWKIQGRNCTDYESMD